MDLDTHELAWAAGFFDGEGTTGTNGSVLSLNLSIGQVDRRPLERFLAAVGGLGTIDGPHLHRTDNRNSQPQWRYRLRAWRDVQAVVAMLWPFLTEPKREQASRALRAFHSAPRKISQPRLVNGRAEVCGRGHPMDSSAYTRPNGVRQCRVCINALARERWKDPEFRSRRIASNRAWRASVQRVS